LVDKARPDMLKSNPDPRQHAVMAEAGLIFMNMDSQIMDSAADSSSGRRFRRGPAMSVLVTVLSLVMMYWFHLDFLYFFRIGEPQFLGEASELDFSRLKSNSYVRMEGYPWEANTISFEQGVRWSAFDRNRYAFFPLLGQKRLFVQYRLPEKPEKESELPGEFTGRLIRAEDTDRSYKRVQMYMTEQRGMPALKGVWILIDGETPASKWWALLLELLFLSFIIVNVRLLYLYILRMREM